MNYGDGLKRARNSKKMSQKQLADNMGVSYQSIQQYEKNKIAPHMKMINKIAVGLDMPIDELMSYIVIPENCLFSIPDKYENYYTSEFMTNLDKSITSLKQLKRNLHDIHNTLEKDFYNCACECINNKINVYNDVINNCIGDSKNSISYQGMLAYVFNTLNSEIEKDENVYIEMLCNELYYTFGTCPINDYEDNKKLFKDISKLLKFYSSLNKIGQSEALKRLEELTLINKYI